MGSLRVQIVTLHYQRNLNHRAYPRDTPHPFPSGKTEVISMPYLDTHVSTLINLQSNSTHVDLNEFIRIERSGNTKGEEPKNTFLNR